MKTVASLGAAILILATCGGASGGTSGVASEQSGDSSAHAINKTVSFQDSRGTTTITVMSARVSDTGPWLNLSGEPVKADGIFVIVSFTFDSPWTASQLLEVKGGDGKLYGPKYSDNPQTLRGAAKKDPNHFTEVFDIPREAANGAVLEIHIGQNYRDPLGEPPTVGRPVPRSYAAQEVDLGLGSGVTGTAPTAVNATVPTQAVAVTKAPTNAAATPTLAPSATGAPTATGQAVAFKADLKAANENPPITDAEATCSGSATITFTATTAKFDITFTGCPATAVINIGHIHEGASGVNGPVKIDSSLKAGELTLIGGRGTLSRAITADATLISRIMANPAGYYVNFHSTVHPGGVMRGQLTRS